MPGPGAVRVRVAATTFNPVDDGIRGGYLQGPFPVALPHIPGIEVSGTVDALGDGVEGLAVDDAVIGFLSMVDDGAAAEFVVAPAEMLTAAPTSVPLADAAALPMTGLTAWQALFEHAGLTAGQRLLINGAGGSVGGYAVQLAHRAGAHVVAIGTARSEAALRELGADEVIDHATVGDVVGAVNTPVDVLLDLAPTDPATFLAAMRDGGTIVNTVPATPAPTGAPRGVRGIDLFVHPDRAQLAELVARVDRGELQLGVDRRVALADLPAIHAEAGAGTLRGKVVVVPSPA